MRPPPYTVPLMIGAGAQGLMQGFGMGAELDERRLRRRELKEMQRTQRLHDALRILTEGAKSKDPKFIQSLAPLVGQMFGQLGMQPPQIQVSSEEELMQREMDTARRLFPQATDEQIMQIVTGVRLGGGGKPQHWYKGGTWVGSGDAPPVPGAQPGSAPPAGMPPEGGFYGINPQTGQPYYSPQPGMKQPTPMPFVKPSPTKVEPPATGPQLTELEERMRNPKSAEDYADAKTAYEWFGGKVTGEEPVPGTLYGVYPYNRATGFKRPSRVVKPHYPWEVQGGGGGTDEEPPE